MTKIVAFLGETFTRSEGAYYGNHASAIFLRESFGVEDVYIASSAVDADGDVNASGCRVLESHFYAFPACRSAKEFVIKSLCQRGFLRNYFSLMDRIIEENRGALFWARTPALGSILFARRVLQKNEKLLHHMCADCSNTWRDKKYGLLERWTGFLLSRYLLHLLRSICRNPNSLNICTGDVLERFSAGVAPSRTKQFVDSTVKPVDFEPRQELRGRLKLLFVGRIVEDKGIFDLLAAVELHRSCIRLKVVGDGPDLERFKSIISRRGLGGVVDVLGAVMHSEMSRVYRDADVVVVPSNNHYEGFPRVIMEAWASGIPVVVSKVGGIGAFLRDGYNGLVFKPGNVGELSQLIELLYTDKDLFERLSCGARSMAGLSLQSYSERSLKNWITEMWDDVNTF